MYLYVRQLSTRLCRKELPHLIKQCCCLSSRGLDEALQNVLSNENKAKTIARIAEYKEQNIVSANLPKTAGVLVALCVVDNEPSLLLTVRSSNMRNHRGEVRYGN